MFREITYSGEINKNKYLKQLLRGTVLPITLLKYAQQDADPKIKIITLTSLSRPCAVRQEVLAAQVSTLAGSPPGSISLIVPLRKHIYSQQNLHTDS
jgi:hypothetical protein